MNHNDKLETILFLKPNSEFSLIGDDLIWLDKEQTKPTEAQIEAGWIAYQASKKAETEAKASAKTAAQAKLAALGFTVEDLSALGL